MSIEKLSEQIAVLNNRALDEVFRGDVMISEEYLKIITRFKQRHILRDLYLQRAVLYCSAKEYEKACLDYFHSARLGNPFSKSIFSEFTGQQLQHLLNEVQVPDGVTADTAFMAFLQHSAGIGKPINHVKALFGLKCSAQLGHPFTKNLCSRETIELIQHCIMQSNKNGTFFVSISLDDANSMIGTYYLLNGFQGKALPYFEASAVRGSSYGYEGLACLHCYNDAYPADYFKSLRLYAIAAEGGNTQGIMKNAYLMLNHIAYKNPDETMSLLNDLAQSNIVSLGVFSDALSKMLNKRYFSFWSNNIELPGALQNKIHEVLALCEITQKPCDALSGLHHMKAIKDFSQCSQAICTKLIEFHRNFPGRNAINQPLIDLLAPFAALSNGEEIKVLNNAGKTMQALT